MCTLIAIHRKVPGRWLVVAANRDEYLDRPAEGPALRRGPGGAVVAPLDAQAGGTWLGLNAHGVFVALTNLRTGEPNPTLKSRGAVVMDALAFGSADATAGALARLPRDTYNSFNCFVADPAAAYLITYRDRPEVHSLAPGVHVVGNADAAAAIRNGSASTAPAAGGDAGAADVLGADVLRADGLGADALRADVLQADVRQAKVDRVHDRARTTAELPPEEVLSSLADVCREHGTGQTPLDDTCVHMADTYGTRSSILLEIAHAPENSRLLYAEGAPCSAPYDDFSSLLTELRQSPGYGSAEAPTRTTS